MTKTWFKNLVKEMLQHLQRQIEAKVTRAITLSTKYRFVLCVDEKWLERCVFVYDPLYDSVYVSVLFTHYSRRE